MSGSTQVLLKVSLLHSRYCLVLLDTSILQRSRQAIENHLAEDVSESLGTHSFER